MIEIKIIPDGMVKIPAEAREQDILASCLQSESNSGYSWRDVTRVMSGSDDYIKLQMSGGINDYNQTTLDQVVSSITNNINGVKTHPDGWVEV